MSETQGIGDVAIALARQPLRLVLARAPLDGVFGRLLVGGGFVNLGRAKPAVPLAVFLGQWVLCAEHEHAEPMIRFGGDTGFGGCLYRAFSVSPWPKWAAPLEELRRQGAWPPWRLECGWLKPRRDVALHVDGACRAVDEWLAWRDDQRMCASELWSHLVELAQGAGWSDEEFDPRLRRRFGATGSTGVSSNNRAPSHTSSTRDSVLSPAEDARVVSRSEDWNPLEMPTPTGRVEKAAFTEVDATAPPDLLADPESRRWLQHIFEREAFEMLSTTDVLTRWGLSRFLASALRDPCFREITGEQPVQLVDERVVTVKHRSLEWSSLHRAFEHLKHPLRVLVSPAHAGSLLILEYLRHALQLPIHWKVAYGHSVEIAEHAARGSFAEQVDAFTLTLASAGSLLHRQHQGHRPGIVMPSMSHGLLAPCQTTVAAPHRDGTYLLMRELPSSELLVFHGLNTRRVLSRSDIVESDPIETTQALASRDASLRTVIGFPHYHFNQRYNGCQLLNDSYEEPYIKPVLLFVAAEISRDDQLFNALQHAVREAWLSLAERQEQRQRMVTMLLNNPKYTTTLLRATGVSMLGLKSPRLGVPAALKPPAIEVRRCSAAEILSLRHRVLRPGYPKEEVIFEQDDSPESIHYSAVHAGEIIGCVSFLESSLGESAALQLRAMATDPSWTGRGVGGTLMRIAAAELGSQKGTLVWCNARQSSRGFYEKHGWHAISEVFANGNAGPSLKMITLLRNQEQP